MATLIKFLLLLAICVCGSLSCKPKVLPEQQPVILFEDTARLAVLNIDSMESHDFDTTYSFLKLSPADLSQIDSLVNLFISDTMGIYAEDHVGHQPMDIMSREYKAQFVPARSGMGDRMVWVYFFCGPRYRGWTRGLRYTKDGGDCYFQFRINLDAGKYSFFTVNGDA